MERKEYEAPTVIRIEIGFEDRIIAAGCSMVDDLNCPPPYANS